MWPMKSKNKGNFSMTVRLREESSYNIFKENKVRMSTNISWGKNFLLFYYQREYKFLIVKPVRLKFIEILAWNSCMFSCVYHFIFIFIRKLLWLGDRMAEGYVAILLLTCMVTDL